MSSENVEVVRRAYEDRWIDRHPQRLLELADEHIRYINPAEAVETGVREGREAVLEALMGLSATFPSAEHELLELFDAGDRVVASVRYRARARDGSCDLVQQECHTWSFRDGRIVAFEWGRDLNAALQAVRGDSGR